MCLSLGCDLRAMRHGEQLLASAGKARQPLTNGRSHRTANATVNLVKNDRRSPAFFRQSDFERENKARQFAP